MTRYSINGTEFTSNSPLFQAALESAYKARIRPICLCVEPGLPMYIAHLEKTFVVKRMPDTGATHGPACESFEAPPGLSGRGEVNGQAIENTDDGSVKLKLAFSLRHNNPAEMENESSQKTTAKTAGTRLTLRGLLHYLWDESKLSHWSPEMHGKRSWSAVQAALMAAVESKETKSATLRDILYIPELYDREKRFEIASRRINTLSPIMGPGKSGKKLMLVVGEMDSKSASTFGFSLRLKNLPDFPFVMDVDLNKSFEKVFLSTVNVWDQAPGAHLVVIATFAMDDKGSPLIEEMCVMCTSPDWLPVDNKVELELIEVLVEQNRSFQKQLRYNLPPDKAIATAVLTDCYNAPVAMYIDAGEIVGRWASTEAISEVAQSNSIQTWTWLPCVDAKPELPLKLGEVPKPIQPPAEPLPTAKGGSTATPPGDWGVISEPSAVAAVQQHNDSDELSRSGPPPLPSAFQPKKNTNLIEMPESAPRLADVTPIRPTTPDVSLIPFLKGHGLHGPIDSVEPVQPVEPGQ